MRERLLRYYEGKKGVEKVGQAVDDALKEFRGQNGYDFFEFLTNDKARKKHQLKQHQIPSYDDDDFLKAFQDEQDFEKD
ncbi:hypothetical protein BSNK01_12200 [Bacillaceae bacterium]